MKILDIKIENFRGIKKLYYDLSTATSNIMCIIGKNDCKKSTLLRAIEILFYPTYSLPVNTSDFYQGNLENAIKIEATFTDFPEEFLLPNSYGKYLTEPGLKKEPAPRSFPEDSKIQNSSDVVIGDRSWKEIITFREPENPNRLCLRAQLYINSSLEPEWFIVSDSQEPTIFKMTDRKKLTVSVIGLDCKKDLSWGQSSILRKYYEGNNFRGDTKQIATEALKKLSLGENPASESLSQSLKPIPEILKKYGISLSGELSNQLDIRNIETSLSVFEGSISLAARGLGSQRLASIALNLEARNTKALILIDEIETSLEPHRIRNLIHHLRERTKDSGQIIFTTHSPIALDECNASEIYVMHDRDVENKLYSVGNVCNTDKLQATFRRNNKCLLGHKIVICEGNTEVEFLKAIEATLFYPNNMSFAFWGVEILDAHGSDNILPISKMLTELGYKTCILLDSDKPDIIKDLKEAHSSLVIEMQEGKCFEERVCSDAPLYFITHILEYIHDYELLSDDNVINQFKNIISATPIDRINLGKKANCHKLFKKNNNAQVLCEKLMNSIVQKPDFYATTILGNIILTIQEWISNES